MQGCSRWLSAALCCGLMAQVGAAPATTADQPVVQAVVTIIIDDLGNGGPDGERAVVLPGPIACAVLPHTPHGRVLAERAYALGKEVLLHLPLEALDNNDLLGNGAIKLDDSAQTLARVLHENLASIPHVTGVNNHMGSLLTRHPGHMAWLMREIADRGELFFVDSVTTRHSVALDQARKHALPALKRDVFLDRERDRDYISRQFAKLVARARDKGFATAIGHPFPETLDVLETQLPRLAESGVRLVSVSDMIRRQNALQKGTVRMAQHSAESSGVALSGGGVGLIQRESK